MPRPFDPSLLDAVAEVSVMVGIICSLLIALDLARRHQKMWIMNLVWPLTGLYAGPLALVAHVKTGREPPAGEKSQEQPKKPFWQSVLTGCFHCDVGCTVGDFISEWFVFGTGVTIFGSKLGAKFGFAFAFAYLAGIFFQFFSIVPMRGLGLKAGLWAAIKADTFSLIAYEVGMFAWMAVVQKMLFPGIDPTRWLFWFMMQIAMLTGLATAYPVNWWLIRKGLKEAM